jgi:hypothetical protein
MVLFGQRERENEAVYDVSAAAPAQGLAAAAASGSQQHQQHQHQPAAVAADAPAGDASVAQDAEQEQERLLATGARGDKVLADFTSHKVGMEYEERTAADRYVTRCMTCLVWVCDVCFGGRGVGLVGGGCGQGRSAGSCVCDMTPWRLVGSPPHTHTHIPHTNKQQSESRDNEPISNMKQPGPKCDLCEW